MRRIFVNTAINHYHQNRKYFDHVDSSYAETMLSSSANIIGDLSNQELMEMVNRMPDGYKLIFNLHVAEGIQPQNIATVNTFTDLQKGEMFPEIQECPEQPFVAGVVARPVVFPATFRRPAGQLLQ